MFEFKLPDISQNQLLQSGLGLLGAGRDRRQNPYLAVAQGLQSGRAQDKAAEDEKRQAELYEMQRAEMLRTQQQQQRWDAMFQPPGGGQVGPQYAQAGGAAPGGGAMSPGGSMLPAGMQGNPQAAAALQNLGPQAGGRFLLEQMFKKPGERKVIKGADGFNYFADTGERVLPGVESADPKPTPVMLNAMAQGLEPGTQPYNDYINKVTTQAKTKIDINQGGGPKLSKGQEAVDKAYAPDYADFVAGGGYADQVKNLEQIEGVILELEKGEGLTGGLGARLPDFVRAYVDPEGLNVQQLTEEVVQRNLKEVLGAQFTEGEGTRLIARAYNPQLSEEVNAARLKRLVGAMREGLQARKESAEYFEGEGTLKGYKGTRRITTNDLYRAIEKSDGGDSGSDKFSGLSADELLNFDVNSIETEDDVEQYQKAMEEAGLM